MKSFEWFVARKHSFFSLTTGFSVAGVAFGVMTLIVVLSVMSGFGKDLRDKTLGIKAHMIIEAKDFSAFSYPNDITQLKEAHPTITKLTPYILKEMMVRHEKTVTGLLLKGMEHFPAEEKKTRSGFPAIVLGKELAETLGAFEGDVIDIISPFETTGPLGSIPKMRKFEVVGLLQTGVYEYDMKLSYVRLQEAQDFFEYGNKIDGIEVWVSNIDKTEAVLKRIQSLLPLESFLVRDWKMLNKNLLGALKLEKIAMFVILSFIVLVAALNIITAMTRTVLEKKKEIAILKTMGAKSKHILMIFLIQGLCIGFSGVMVGSLGGFGMCYLLNHYQFIRLPDIYYSTVVPVDVELSSILMIAVIAFGITLLSALYPAWRASKLIPLEGIRY